MGHAAVIASLGALAPLLVKLAALLAGEYGRLHGVRREILSLQRELASMHAAVRRYRTLDDPDAQVEEWVSMVRELARDVEGIVDSFIRRLDDDGGGGGGGGGGLRKLLGRTARRLNLGARRGFADQVDKLKARIEHAKELRECYRLDGHMAHAAVVVANVAGEDHLSGWTLVRRGSGTTSTTKQRRHEMASIAPNSGRSSVRRLQGSEHPTAFEPAEEDWVILHAGDDDFHDALAFSSYRCTTSGDDESSGSPDPVHGFCFYDGGAALLVGDGTRHA